MKTKLSCLDEFNNFENILFFQSDIFYKIANYLFYGHIRNILSDANYQKITATWSLNLKKYQKLDLLKLFYLMNKIMGYKYQNVDPKFGSIDGCYK